MCTRMQALAGYEMGGGGGGGGGGGLSRKIWSGGKIGQAGPNMTPKFVRLIQNWSGHINTSYTWRLVLFYVKMDYSSEEGDAKNGNLIEEAYETMSTW